jgi:hypothetical protein
LILKLRFVWVSKRFVFDTTLPLTGPLKKMVSIEEANPPLARRGRGREEKLDYSASALRRDHCRIQVALEEMR